MARVMQLDGNVADDEMVGRYIDDASGMFESDFVISIKLPEEHPLIRMIFLVARLILKVSLVIRYTGLIT